MVSSTARFNLTKFDVRPADRWGEEQNINADRIDQAAKLTELESVSGTLSSEIDSDIATHTANTSAHHSRYTDNEAIVATDASRYTLSGTLSSEIDSDISTHTGITDAHHSRYTDGEAVAATESARYTLSGTLSAEIDNDITTHTSDSSAHHTRYEKSENDALIGSDGITVSSGSNTIGIAGFRSEFVSASGSLDYNKVDRSGDTMWGTLDIQDGANLIVDGDATTSGSLSVGSGGAGDAVVNWIVNDSLTYVMGVDDSDSDKFKISTSAGLGLGDSVAIDTNGDITTAGELHASGGFYPRRLYQAAIPASGSGATQIDGSELIMWTDSDNGNVYLVYNDPLSGVVSVNLT